MTDKDRIRILRNRLRTIADYLENVSDFVDGTPGWKTNKESGLGSEWRACICALKITRRTNRKPAK